MLRISGRRRAFALVWALLQFALPAFGTLVEASVADSAASRPATAHVEERSGPGCQPVHAPDCARCQTLSTHAAAPTPALDWGRLTPHVFHPTEVAVARSGARLALPLSRAPPHSS